MGIMVGAGKTRPLLTTGIPYWVQPNVSPVLNTRVGFSFKATHFMYDA